MPREDSLQQVSWLFLSDVFGCKGNVVSNVIWQIYATLQELLKSANAAGILSPQLKIKQDKGPIWKIKKDKCSFEGKQGSK